jgi:hypothetical protein
MSNNNFEETSGSKPVSMDSPVDIDINKNYEPNFNIPLSSSPPKLSNFSSSPLSSSKMTINHRHKSSSSSPSSPTDDINNAHGSRSAKSLNENDNDGEENYTERVLEDEARKNNIMNRIKVEKLNRSSSFDESYTFAYSNQPNRVRTHSNHSINTFDESDATTQDSLKLELKERGIITLYLVKLI